MSPRSLFQDRADAGRQRAARLRSCRETAPLVLGLPRGGARVAYEVARELDAPLDVCVVRKIGAPIQPELGIGAVSEDGAVYVDTERMTGGTARAALQTLRARGAGRIVLAVPVAASHSLDELASAADEIVCLYPEDS